jgi:hypothetical protein
LAHCLSFGINALHGRVNPYGAGISDNGLTRRMAQADIVAQAVDLDMVEAGYGTDGTRLERELRGQYSLERRSCGYCQRMHKFDTSARYGGNS